MSYILDALKKSDQQRRHATVPTLSTAHSAAQAPKQTHFSLYALLAVVLIGAGILIGWLQPWRATAPQNVRIEPVAPVNANLPATDIQTSEMHATALALPAKPPMKSNPASTNPAIPTQLQPATTADHPVPASATERATPSLSQTPNPTQAAPETQVLKQSELPSEIQQSLPNLVIAFHQYSRSPSERRVMINNVLLRQGEFITPDLKLEQITPEGMVLGFQGYRFSRGVR
jgi:general secretion pathway protein B